MNTSTSSMIVAGLFAAASLASFTAANAQSPDRLSDVAYIAAARCAGLAEGAKVDTKAIKSLLVNQDNDRPSYILEKADEVRSDARRQAGHAQGYNLQTVNAELSGACQPYMNSSHAAADHRTAG